MTPEVTVVIPTHNRSAMLSTALRTVLWQRDVDLEAVVVDDGSTDDTARVVSDLGDGRVRLMRHPTPMGMSVARNHGIAEARGQWIAFLDDDDVWAPEKLARQLESLLGGRSAWVYAGAVRINMRLQVVGGSPPPPPGRVVDRLPRWNPIPGGCSNVMVATQALATVGGFDPNLMNLADWDLWVRLGGLGAPAWTAKPLVGYRLHTGQSSSDTAAILSEAERIDLREDFAVDRGALHHYLAWVCLRSGRRLEALSHFARAAARRQIRPIAGDLVSIVNKRAAARIRHWPCPRARNELWKAQAEVWLADVR